MNRTVPDQGADQPRHYWSAAQELRKTRADGFAITVGLAACIFVTGLFLVKVAGHEHLRALLLAALVEHRQTLNEARLIMSSGTEGYFAPGYVKHFGI